MNVLTYNGIASDAFQIIVAGSGSEKAAARNREEITVPGRNGSIFIDSGSFKNVKTTYDIVLPDATIENLAAISRWLLGPEDYTKLQESEKPEYYREAIFDGSFEAVRAALNEKGKATLSFTCKPQKYLQENGQEVEIDLDVSGGLLSYTEVPNTGDFPYKPRFEITLPAYTFQNNTGLQINHMDADFDISVLFEIQATEDWSGKTLAVDFENKTVLLDGTFPTGLTLFRFQNFDMQPGSHQFAIGATTNNYTSITPTAAKAYPRSWVL